MKRDKKFIGGYRNYRERIEKLIHRYIYIYTSHLLETRRNPAVEDSETRDEEVNSLIYPPLTG